MPFVVIFLRMMVANFTYCTPKLQSNNNNISTFYSEKAFLCTLLSATWEYSRTIKAERRLWLVRKLLFLTYLKFFWKVLKLYKYRGAAQAHKCYFNTNSRKTLGSRKLHEILKLFVTRWSELFLLYRSRSNVNCHSFTFFTYRQLTIYTSKVVTAMYRNIINAPSKVWKSSICVWLVDELICDEY